MSQEPEDSAENVRMLTDSASAVVPADGSLDRVRAARFQPPGFSRDDWETMVDMGWLGLRVGEEAGGLGLGMREAVALSRVSGRRVDARALSARAICPRSSGGGRAAGRDGACPDGRGDRPARVAVDTA